MAVTCSKCGEELLGAVNRCWRCGAKFMPHHGDTGVPPVRQSPPGDLNLAQPAAEPPSLEDDIPVAEAATPDVADASIEPGGQPGVDPPPDRVDLSGVSAPVVGEVAVQRTGTPADDRESPQFDRRTSPPPAEKGATAAKVAVHGFSFVRFGERYRILLGLVSIVLGLASVFLAPQSIWAVPVSLAGLAVGIWGLFGARGGLALTGILICCVAFTLSGYRGLIATYTWYTGYSPFDHRPVDETLESEDADGDDWTEEDWLDEGL